MQRIDNPVLRFMLELLAKILGFADSILAWAYAEIVTFLGLNWQSMSPGKQAIYAVTLVVVVGGLVWLVWRYWGVAYGVVKAIGTAILAIIAGAFSFAIFGAIARGARWLIQNNLPFIS